MSLQQLHAHAHHAQGTPSQVFTPMNIPSGGQTIPHPNTQSPAVPLSPCSSIDSQRMKTMSGKVKILFCLLIFHVPTDVSNTLTSSRSQIRVQSKKLNTLQPISRR
jgi:hypothetical protein